MLMFSKMPMQIINTDPILIEKIVANEISKELMNINNDNFKSSVSKDDFTRINAYINVWSALNKMQS